MASCGGWSFEMGAWVKSCRCKPARAIVASAFVEQEGRRWATTLSVRNASSGDSRWRQLIKHFSPTRRAAQKYARNRLAAHLKRVCK